jgi:Cell wall binding domain 2 (CWB2)
VRPKRPINADVPALQAPAEEETKPASQASEAPKPEAKLSKPEAKPASDAKPPRPRRPRSPAPFLLAGLVVLALVFIVVAIVGGRGGGESTEAMPAPSGAGSAAEPDSPEAAAQSAEALGYPSFATDNTTRVGGADPVANAAAASLAVFPSTTPSQRPAAVTLVSEEDWAGAIAAAVLMAPPVRAPLLFSAAGELPEASAEALAALDPQGGERSGGSSIFAIGSVPLPSGASATRVDSGDAASTAAQIATLRERLSGAPPKHVVIAPSADPELAMPAAAWAARSGDPVLYAGRNELPQPTRAAIERHPKAPVYVLGPSTAISSQVVREIGRVARSVKRVSGEDPVANAVAFARYHDGSFGWNVNDPGHGFVLARSDSPLDGAAAAPLSAAGTWGPLLLSDDAGTLPAEVRNYLLDVKPGYTTNPTRAFYNHVWVIGDQEAIDVKQQAEVNELAELARIGGGG